VANSIIRPAVDNPNTVFVFAFADDDLPGYVPQRFHRATTTTAMASMTTTTVAAGRRVRH
jgi:hypothetical protein